MQLARWYPPYVCCIYPKNDADVHRYRGTTVKCLFLLSRSARGWNDARRATGLCTRMWDGARHMRHTSYSSEDKS